MGRKGWHKRGYLPHLDAYQIVQHIVFRLADALPPGLHEDSDEVLDAGHGACVLRDPENARIVAAALRHFDGQRYRLHAWCIMPNHVHVIVETFRDHEIGAVVRSWKTFSARHINERLGRHGALWASDYFDRFMRDNDHFSTAKAYVERNPVKAGLCDGPQDWPFGSAGWRD